MKLFYTALISLLFVSTSSLVLGKEVWVRKQKQEDVVYKISKLGNYSNLPSLPVLNDGSTFPLLSAQAVYVLDMDSGVSLFEKNPDTQYLPASTTKIVTALVAMDYYPMDMIITVGKVNVEGQKMHLVEGEQMTVRDLLYGLLVYSANDAAEVLAANYPGGREVFINAMNLKAKEMNLEHTEFSNPVGLDGVGHLTTAKDLTRAAVYAMRNPDFAKFVSTKSKTVKSVDGRIVHRLTNINELLGSVDGVLGVKTGWTQNARENLVTYIDRNNTPLMITLLGSQDRFGETKELIDWLYSNYKWVKVDENTLNNYSLGGGVSVPPASVLVAP